MSTTLIAEKDALFAAIEEKAQSGERLITKVALKEGLAMAVSGVTGINGNTDSKVPIGGVVVLKLSKAWAEGEDGNYLRGIGGKTPAKENPTAEEITATDPWVFTLMENLDVVVYDIPEGADNPMGYASGSEINGEQLALDQEVFRLYPALADVEQWDGLEIYLQSGELYKADALAKGKKQKVVLRAVKAPDQA